MNSREYDVRHVVQDLLFRPVAYVPFSAELIAEAKDAYLTLIDLFREFGGSTSLVRNGEGDPDMGLISRRGEHGLDIKDFFHFGHDLGLQLVTTFPELERLAKPHLQVLQRLYDAVNDLAAKIARGIDEGHGKFFTRRLEPAVRQSAKLSQPYATTTLRGLYYPPIIGQTGARTHIDRSLLSIHFGDEGGRLMTRNNEHGKLHRPVEIPEGHVAVFRGVKIWLLSRRKFAPIWHYSTTVPGQPRLAMVQFIQAETPGIYVHNARDAYDMFRIQK